MGKEIIINTLEEMCDLMCGGVEEDEEMCECFHCGHKAVIRDSDFDFDDYGYKGNGIIHVCHCTNYGADIMYRISCDVEEEDEANRAE